jgi:hypothetical protein
MHLLTEQAALYVCSRQGNLAWSYLMHRATMWR